MTITMTTPPKITITQIEKFLKGSENYNFNQKSKKEMYEWLQNFLIEISYRNLRKKKKKTVKMYIKKLTGYSDIQIKRLLKKYRDGTLKWTKWQLSSFSSLYSETDIGLLHNVDSVHRMSGHATKKILEREFSVFKKNEYEKISQISCSHIYNLRKKISYLRRGKIFGTTKYHGIAIGKRMKPRPEGRPGFLRVDSVHQGDKDKAKGVYFINVVDEVTQSEYVFCVPGISEKYLKVVLEDLYCICPFIIVNFHSDNGSEYINKVVAEILNRLHIKQTKSRPRRHNDNALVETKNGSIIRKTFGYTHIPATEENAKLLNQFCQKWLIPYLNYHRPCGFARSKFDRKGKEKKIYETYMTPYEKLKSIKNADGYLRRQIFFEDLDKKAYAESDTEFGLKMNEEKEIMFRKLKF